MTSHSQPPPPSSDTPSTPPPSLVKTSTHLFFYGHDLTTPEGHLQMWYPSVIVEDVPPTSSSTSSSSTTTTTPPLRFPTCEHYMTYHKALLMHDHATAHRILSARTPLEANLLGRQVHPYDSALWRRERDRIAEQGNWLKFSQIKECREALLGTGNLELVEASPGDRVWGIGFRGDEAVGREGEWGENVLGRALGRVRERLRGVEKGGEGGKVDGKRAVGENEEETGLKTDIPPP